MQRGHISASPQQRDLREEYPLKMDCWYVDLIPTNIPTMVAGFVGTWANDGGRKKPPKARLFGGFRSLANC
ncbi:hypothetical protein C1H71_10425 [Iodobacter fluviatilis]|uniref:Uncharacterized protein n=1 Tax=Iodobacter fluviatilis TaxID=537 RepID=A0A7G3G9E4_9NEIS|nr:hypothetical protein C1H71_10425 [Iodobacter fluviatilis]